MNNSLSMNSPYGAMFILAGEQTAPNLLPARHFQVNPLIIFHTDFHKSLLMAQRLAQRLQEFGPELRKIEAFDVGAAKDQITLAMQPYTNALVNVTGGTKPMSIAALIAAQEFGYRPFYVRTQHNQTQIDMYAFDQAGTPKIERSFTITDTISLDDYLVSYFGTDYESAGIGGLGRGRAFELAIQKALIQSDVDEFKTGWKHASGSVDVDFVLRCNNQIGIIEAKTGKKGRSTEGIKQLTLAGGQRFFGTFVKRFLIIDSKMPDNNRDLAKAIGITLIELTDFDGTQQLSSISRSKLFEIIHNTMGCRHLEK